MVEENFEIWPSEMLQIGLILLFSTLHYMVEENFEIWPSEMHQIKVAHGFETAVSIFDEFTDFSLYNLLYDKEHYIGI